jgi:muramidase (phage lysozyme)
MAINADKLLNKSSGRLAMQKAQQDKMVGGGPANIVLTKKSIKGIESIKINVIKIENILKGSLALDKKQLDDKKKATSKKRKEDIETKLETKPNAESGKVKMPSAPRMGILDFIKNFIGNVLLGYFAVRLIKHLPKIMPIVKFLGNAADFIINTGGELLNGLVTFIDIGYKAYDATRGFIKNLGGENFAKGFDKFIGAIDTALFLTTALAGSMAMEAMSGGGGPGGGKGGGPLKSGKQIYKEYDQKRAFIRKKHGDAAARIYDNEISNGKTPKQAFENLKNRYISKGRITSQRALGLGEIKGSKLFDKGFDKAPGRLATRILGRSGKKAILGVVRPLLKRLPIIGALIDFGLSVALGEDPGRAAFKAIGAGLLGTVGAAIGSLAFGFGGIVGGILGSIGGDALGGALYDTFFGGKNPQQKGKVQGKAGGGITRGGKSQRGAKRTISKGKYKRVLTPQKPSKTELKTEAFTKPENKTLKESTEELDKTKYFGPILAISSKIMNKEEPTDRDYQNVGLGINLLIAKGIQDKQLKGGIVAKFAGGGLVDPDVLSAAETGGDISNWVAKAFRGAIETGAQKTMRLMKEMREMKKIKEKTGSGENEYGGDGDGGGGGSLTSGVWGPILDLIASKESGGSYTKMYGGKENPSLVNMTLQEVSAFQAAHAKKTGSAAMGRYQFMNALGQGDAVGLKPTDKFSPENQDKMAVGLIVNKRKVTLDMIKSNPDEAMIRLGMEWAAIGMPKSMRGHRRMVAAGETYYAGDGVNKAHITPAQMRAAFAKTVGGGYSQAELAKSQAGSVGSSMQLGAGYGSGGSKISGELGRFIKQKLKSPKDFQAVTEHPEHGGVRGRHANKSYHYEGRALDIGAYTHEQGPIVNVIAEFNKLKGVKPVELITGRTDPGGHGDHVHVAYAKGGRVLKPTFAMLGEKGQEFVFDADTTRGLDGLAPLLLDKLNIAKTKPQLANILQSYASYDANASSQTIIVQSSPPPPPSDGYGSGGNGGVAVIPIPVDNFTEILAMIG